MFDAYPMRYRSGSSVSAICEEVTVQPSKVRQSWRHEVYTFELWRSRTRTRRRRRKRSWGAPWAHEPVVCLRDSTISSGPARFLPVLLFHREYDRPAEYVEVIACSH